MLDSFGTAVRVVLAAFLAATGVTPSIQHAHADGDQPHTYADRVECIPQHRADLNNGHREHSHGPAGATHGHKHRHSHSHSHSHVERHADPNVPEPCVLCGGTVHRHVWLLGIEWSYPLPESPEEGSEPDGDAEFIVRLLDHCSLSRSYEAGSTSFLATLPLQLRWYEAPVPAASRLAATAVLAAPLCDTARHERSGVQLA